MRNNGDFPCPQFSPLIISRKDTVQCHPQDTDLDAVKIHNSSITGPSCCPLLPHLLPPSHLTPPYPWQPLTVLCFYNIVISKMFCKCQHRACLWRLAAFIQHHCLEIHPGACVTQQFVSFYCRAVFQGSSVARFV